MEFFVLTLYRWLLLLSAGVVFAPGFTALFIDLPIAGGGELSFMACVWSSLAAFSLIVASEFIRLIQRIESHLHDINYRTARFVADRDKQPEVPEHFVPGTRDRDARFKPPYK